MLVFQIFSVCPDWFMERPGECWSNPGVQRHHGRNEIETVTVVDKVPTIKPSTAQIWWLCLHVLSQKSPFPECFPSCRSWHYGAGSGLQCAVSSPWSKPGVKRGKGHKFGCESCQRLFGKEWGVSWPLSPLLTPCTLLMAARMTFC